SDLLRGGDPRNGRVVGQIDEQHSAVQGARLAEAFHEEVGFFKCNTHSRKYNGKVLIFSEHLCLARDLCRQLRVGQAGRREDRQLLPSYQRVQSVDCGHTGLDKLFRVASGRRVHGQAVDVHACLRQDLRSVVDGTAQTIEHAAQHVFGYTQLHAPSKETDFAVGQVDTGGVLKELHEHIASVY